MTQNIQANGAGGLYGTSTVYGGGGMVSARDILDYARLGSPGRTPEAEYPDGYLGTRTGSRREDKLLDKIGSMNRRSYVRGVHKGERIDPGDYVWPANWRPDRGLQFEAMGAKTMLAADGPEPRLTHAMRDMPPPPVSGPVGTDPHRNGQLAHLLPAWR